MFPFLAQLLVSLLVSLGLLYPLKEGEKKRTLKRKGKHTSLVPSKKGYKCPVRLFPHGSLKKTLKRKGKHTKTNFFLFSLRSLLCIFYVEIEKKAFCVLPILFISFVIRFPGIKLSSQKAPLSVLSLLKRLTTKFGMVWCGSDLVKTPGIFLLIIFKRLIFLVFFSYLKKI